MNLKNNRAGFSLLELLIVIAIAGMMAAALIPLLTSMQPGYGRKQFVSKLNALVQFGWQQAVITRKVHRVLFDIKNRKASLEVEGNKIHAHQTGLRADQAGVYSHHDDLA